MKEQAEQDYDREDDPAFDESETAWNTNQQSTTEESKEENKAVKRSPAKAETGNASDDEEGPMKPAGKDEPRKSNSKSSHQFISQPSTDSAFYDTKKDSEIEVSFVMSQKLTFSQEKIWQ